MNYKTNIPDWLLQVSFFYEENKKGILICILFVLFFAFLFLPYDKVKTFFYDYDCVAELSSWQVKTNTGISHSLEGSSIKIHSYTLIYSYFVDGLSYEESIVLSANLSNNKFIDALQKNNKSSFIVKYNCDNPYKSVLSFDSD